MKTFLLKKYTFGIMNKKGFAKNQFAVYIIYMSKIRYNYSGNSGRGYYSPKKSGKNFWVFFWIVLLFFCAWGVYKLCFGKKTDNVKDVPAVVEISTEKKSAASDEKNVKKSDSVKNPVKTAEKVVKKVQDIEIEKDAENYPLGAVTLENVVKLKNAENNKLFAKMMEDTDYQGAKLLLLKELSILKNKKSLYFRTLGKYLRALNNKILFGGVPGGKNENYSVQSGDSLSRIAIRYNLPVTAIIEANKLKSSTIYPGQKLRIYKGNWRIEVSKLAKLLYVYDGDDLFAIYDIGIGKEGRTPKGDFILTDKIEHPSWYSPDGRVVPYGEKENVLGTHWLKIEPAGNTDSAYIGYGIHGTWDEGSITKSLSNGCIRMTNEEVAELFKYIPRKTPVKIY